MAPIEQPKLTLDQFAQVSARLDVGFPDEGVLADAGVSKEEWEATQTYWLGKMAVQAADNRNLLCHRYIKLFATHRQEAAQQRKAQRKVLEGPLPVPPVFAESPCLVGVPQASPPPVPPAQREWPTPAALATPLPSPPPPAASALWPPEPAALPVDPPLANTPPPNGMPWVATPPPPAQPAALFVTPPLPSLALPVVANPPPPNKPPMPGAQSNAPANGAPVSPETVESGLTTQPHAVRGTGTPNLTVEEFARLSAELAVTPRTQHVEVLKRYYVDASRWRSEEDAWAERMKNDPALHERFRHQFHYARALLVAQ